MRSVLEESFVIDNPTVQDLIVASDDSVLQYFGTDLGCPKFEAAISLLIDYDVLQASDDLACDQMLRTRE